MESVMQTTETSGSSENNELIRYQEASIFNGKSCWKTDHLDEMFSVGRGIALWNKVASPPGKGC